MHSNKTFQNKFGEKKKEKEKERKFVKENIF